MRPCDTYAYEFVFFPRIFQIPSPYRIKGKSHCTPSLAQWDSLHHALNGGHVSHKMPTAQAARKSVKAHFPIAATYTLSFGSHLGAPPARSNSAFPRPTPTPTDPAKTSRKMCRHRYSPSAIPQESPARVTLHETSVMRKSNHEAGDIRPIGLVGGALCTRNHSMRIRGRESYDLP